MKKYIKPQIEVADIETESFLCASDVEETLIQDEITESNEILSKENHGSIWDLDD